MPDGATTLRVLSGNAHATNVYLPSASPNDVQYTIVGGADASTFTLTLTGGGAAELSFVTPPNIHAPHDQGADNTYEVVVSAVSGGVKTTTAYSLQVVPDDHLGAVTTNSTILVGGEPAAGRIDTWEDQDWFRFETDGGGLLLALHGTSRYSLYDLSGSFRGSASGGDPMFQHLDLPAGTYFLSITGSEGATYSVTLAAGPPMVIGTSGDDLRNGGDLADFVAGNLGNDTLNGHLGPDVLFGGLASDALDGGPGRDYLRGDDGDDTMLGGPQFDDMHGNAGDDSVLGGIGDDWVVGGQGSDQLNGEEGRDIVHGSRGADSCYGGVGDDVVRGGQDNDHLVGGEGADFLSGDRGDDTISGGSGADIFHTFDGAGLDRIVDFSAAEGDRIRFETPGISFTATQVGADAIIEVGPFTKIVLVGVQISAMPEGWIG